MFVAANERFKYGYHQTQQLFRGYHIAYGNAYENGNYCDGHIPLGKAQQAGNNAAAE